MTDPALAAEAARIERLLYSRLEPEERARLEAGLAALTTWVVEPVETGIPVVELVETGKPVVELVETGTSHPESVSTSSSTGVSRARVLVIIAIIVALLVGAGGGWLLASRIDARSASSGILEALSRPQVITADDASDIPPVNLGSAYEASTFRHLKVLNAPGVGQEPLGNVYGVVRSSDRAVCLVVVSRSEFVAGSCSAPSEIPAGGLALSVNLRSVEFSLIWRTDGTVTAKSTAI